LYANFPALADLLSTIHHYYLEKVEDAPALSYAAEWILDNYYVIQQALREIKQDLPPTYYTELPKLSDDENGDNALAGYPRIYAVALALLNEIDYQLDAERIVRFALAYQAQQPLNTGELWALPIMLRLSVVQKIALAAGRLSNQLGDSFAANSAFPDFFAGFTKTDVEDDSLSEEQDEVAISHAIPSLRLLDSLDWKDMFERISLVHQALSSDPAGVYPYMDFATRDRYRHVIESLYRRVNLNEVEIAEAAVALAASQGDSPPNVARTDQTGGAVDGELAANVEATPDPGLQIDAARTRHVGYYLIDAGRPLLEQRIQYQPSMGERAKRWAFAHASGIYFLLIAIAVLAVIGVAGFYLLRVGGNAWQLAALSLLILVPALTSGVGFANWVITHTVSPRTLPKLDFQAGVPTAFRTALVMPSLISSKQDIDHLMEEMEQHYLRNSDPQLIYALLTDFLDADQESEADDEALLDYAQTALQALNAKVARAPFYMFHRRRLWNPAQQKWLGWERKRGKLHEFNRLVRGAPDTTYAWQFGDLDQLGHIAYVITLDVDTVLPRGAAARLIGALAHPLNRAVFDARTGKVTAGYTILQPRTEIKPVNVGRSLFTRVFAGDNTLDFYTLAVSDAYQDFFGAGIFVGKGIYAIDAFEQSLVNRAPENALLSHDLFEGIHGRAALITDIVLYEDYPTHYLLAMQRTPRWVRGDWQLLPWLLPRTPRADGSGPNDLALIDRWKIFDNLRRSLFAPVSLLLLILSWTVLPGSPLVWTGLSLLIPAISIAGSLFTSGATMIANLGAWRNILWGLRNGILRWLMFLAFLPYEAQLNLDAIVRTLVRTFVTHRQMLEWTSAAHAARIHSDSQTQGAIRKMLPTLIFATLLVLLIGFVNPAALWVAAPFVLVWISAPYLADWISRPIVSDVASPTPAEARKLRTLARRTWLFYENFVGPEDNWLPPDHFQEAPRGVVAHRTSPTNIGLYLLSALAAFDFGYIRMANFVLRVNFTFDTLTRLQRYRGHFLNWIDTSSLQPLPPPYVSTVDSGNLAAALVVLQQGCLELQSQPVWRTARWQGLLDTVAVVTDIVTSLAARTDNPSAAVLALQECLTNLERQTETAIQDHSGAPSMLAKLLESEQEKLNRCLMTLIADEGNRIDADSLHTVRLYIARIHQHLEGMQSERDEIIPWLPLLAAPPAFLSAADRAESIRGAWASLLAAIPDAPRWNTLGDASQHAQSALENLRAQLAADSSLDQDTVVSGLAWCNALAEAFATAAHNAEVVCHDLARLAEQAGVFVEEMDFSFLYDPTCSLFHIGYNINTGDLDNSYYDLLASEARIASLLAIGKNDVPVKHWLHLSRPIKQLVNGEQALISWSGTMFEYLMPPLLVRTYPETLLEQTYASVIDHQINFGREHDLPWGISESGFYAFDSALNYQYRAFGVPGLGLQRGIGDDLVVAPYASMLALSLRPRPVFSNLLRLEQIKMIGRFGLYEAVDYTPERLSLGQEYAIVQSYMAHHQAMILLGIANYLLDHLMVKRFHAASIIESVDLLLQERIPQGVPAQFVDTEDANAAEIAPPVEDVAPWRVPVDTPMPQVHYLSNGRLSTLITNAGAGYTTGETMRLTRWRADTTLDNWGHWLYVQDLESGEIWSAGRQPSKQKGAYEDVVFYPHMAEFRRRTRAASLHMEVFIAPDANVEVRRVTMTNDSDAPTRLGLSSYSEVVLAPAEADRRHQAFTKLFIESEYRRDLSALIFRRRPRAATEAPAWMLYMFVRGPVPTPDVWGATRFSADRAQFIGRTGSQQSPAALQPGEWWEADWQGNAGATLDPIMALGQEMRLGPRASGQFALVTIQADTQAEALELAQRYSTWGAIDRAQGYAQNQARREMRQFGFTSTLFQQTLQLLSLALYPHAALRAQPETLAANRRGQPGLWAFGISGDYPIVLLHLNEENHISLLQEMLQIHAYWRRRGLKIDLVIVNDRDTSYDQGLHNKIFRVIRRMASDAWLNQRGGLFVLRRDQLGKAERLLLESAARVILDGERGALSQHLSDLYRQPASLPRFVPVRSEEQWQALRSAEQGWIPRPNDLQFDQGLGGFSADGSEYVIYLRPGETTPAPWINVIATPDFGFIASESGVGPSWAINSGENRLTSWRNDPVSNLPSEIIYLRDEETADIWTPTPEPAPAPSPYLIRHGAGYTGYEHHSHALQQHLRVYAAPDAPIKIMRLRLQNMMQTPRRITVTCYAEFVLGVDRETTQPYLAPEYDRAHAAIFMRNAYNEEFGERVAFLAANKQAMSATADRTSFFGRLGSLRRPDALQQIGLTDTIQAGLDPCAVLQLHIDLPAEGVEEVYFLLGEGAHQADSLALVERFRHVEEIDSAWRGVQEKWEQLLGAITVETPDPAMNLLLNRWLLYQALSCRIWGRSALYQSSGAYGFRDQLQDVLALLSSEPQLAREQILRAAAHQFEQGDVLHWWHPPSGRGVRTRIKDDLLWLPYVTAHYIATTGDTAILDEKTPFLTGPELTGEEEERYGHFEATTQAHSLLEHCRRAITRGLTAGVHGLPLMGAGDWNDGMNRVGIEGKGESIWLGWFVYATLNAFADACDAAETTGGEHYRQQAEVVRQAIEAHGWDGAWYRRAYYDDGAPLGSAQNAECQIDAIAQSWAVLSGAGDSERTRQAMDALATHLVKEEGRLLLLFTPAFDKTPRDPGYIKGYLPGIRENGGQYTHAAQWSIWAFAELGDTARAYRLFQMINPILRSDTPAKVEQYKVEPYVISADVYNIAPHVGRGGWTWYTGSAAWMYRVGMEALLGLKLTKDALRIQPRIPAAWPGYSVKWKYKSSEYLIRVENPGGAGNGVHTILLDGAACPGDEIPLRDDGQQHSVIVRLGDAERALDSR
jgi:cyclic beta-1,2-glucan synthetase